MLLALFHPGYGFFWLGPLLFFLLMFGLFAWTGRRRGERPPPLRDRPGLGILEERYARGEIDRDEFLSRRRDLLNGDGEEE